MKSRVPKVLHPLGGLPMVEHACRAAQLAGADPVVVVLGPATESAREMLGNGYVYAFQEAADGTAGAAEAGIGEISADVRHVLVINGDVPLVDSSTLQAIARAVADNDAVVGIATFEAGSNTRYGRVVSDSDGRVTEIIEFAEDSERGNLQRFQANSGVYCFAAEWLRTAIGSIRPSASGERYLTDLVSMANADSSPGTRVIAISGDPESLIGIDDRMRLAEAEATMRQRKLMNLMQDGVTIVDPATTYVDADVQIDQDARIEPGCHIHGQSIIGEGAVIGPGAVIRDSQIGRDAVVRQSWIEGSSVGDRVTIGPYSHLRPGTVIEAGSKIGNYVEMKNTHFGAGSHAGHFSYLGDATIGRGTNIGAGTITCNYDGETKHRTIIGDGVFVGSDSMLIAPIELGDGSATGAGAVVTRSVPPGMRAVGVPARVIGPIQRDAVEETEGRD